MKRIVELHCPRIYTETNVELISISYVEMIKYTEIDNITSLKELETDSKWWTAFGLVELSSNYFIEVEAWAKNKEDLLDPDVRWEEKAWPEGFQKLERILQWNMSQSSTHYKLF